MKSLLLFALGLLVVCVARADLPRRWEAESGSLAGRAEKVSVSTASGGHAVRLALRGRATWNLTAETAGRYELHVRYRTADNAAFPQIVINGHARGLGLTATFGDWTETTLTIPLNAGGNTLAIEGTVTACEIDELRFTALPRTQPSAVYELPEISPRQAHVDLRQPRPMTFLLRGNGHGEPRALLDGKEVGISTEPFAPVEDAVRLTLPVAVAQGLAAGAHVLHLGFGDGAELVVPLEASAEELNAPLLIATLNVNHGKATVIRLPDGQVALIDCAKPEYAKSHLLPFLAAHGIKRIDHLFITHYHDDHVGGREALRVAMPIGAEHDYKSYKTGEQFELGGVSWFVLNAYDAGDDENSRSLSLQLTYRGFVYTDGADNYGLNQMAILEKFPARVRSHVVYGNHHFHGSIDVNYLRRTDAALFLVSADPAVYARAAYADQFKRDVEGYLKAHNGRCRETLLTPEVGDILLRVHDAERWTYETAPSGGVFADFWPLGL